MRKLPTTVLIACFVLISAFAKFGSDYSAFSAPAHVAQQIATVTDGEYRAAAALGDDGRYDEQAAFKEDCPCKKDHSSAKLVCGVTLALSSDGSLQHPPLLRKIRYDLADPSAVRNPVDLLKRPPRIIL